MKNKKGQRGRRNKPAYVEPDRLTKLPHDILLNILERLNTPDAVRTCVLSKRTINLPSKLSRFVVEVGSFAPWEDDDYSLTLRDIIKMNGCVTDAADKILNFRSDDINLTQLSIQFYLRYYDCLSIGNVVARAMAAHKIDIAEYAILTDKAEHATIEDQYGYAKMFNTFILACPDAFAGLTRLHLQNLRFGAESDITNILATCKRLAYLGLSTCTSGTETVLDVQHPQLAELKIGHGEFEVVKLSCVPKLQRMVYDDWNSLGHPLSFGHVPLLSNLHLSNEHLEMYMSLRLSELLGNVTSISNLQLNFKSEKIWLEPESPSLLAPVLEKLQIVDLIDLPEECDIAWTMYILEAAPSLEELCITVWDHWCTMETNMTEREEMGYFEEKTELEWEPSVPGLKHHNLAKLTIYGFQPDDFFVRYIRNVMEAAVNLKEISLYDRKVCPRCDDLDLNLKAKVTPSRYPHTDEERDLLRKHITEGFDVVLPDVVHFRS